MPLSEPKPALLLAAHGTRDQAGVDAFAALAERVGKLAAAVEALRRDAPVIADVAMVASGITGYPVICKIGDSLSARLSRTANITLSAAAVRLAHGEAGPGAIWLVGCAPTALAEIMSRQVEPALVIGVPVGFVGAADAKDSLRASGLPALSNVSEKGDPRWRSRPSTPCSG